MLMIFIVLLLFLLLHVSVAILTVATIVSIDDINHKTSLSIGTFQFSSPHIILTEHGLFPHPSQVVSTIEIRYGNVDS